MAPLSASLEKKTTRTAQAELPDRSTMGDWPLVRNVPARPTENEQFLLSTGGALRIVSQLQKKRTGLPRLPTLATPGDVREVVQYLKKRPAGVSIVEALSDARRVFEPQKVAAYECWGIVERSGERLVLTELGWQFVRHLEPETNAYRFVLEASSLYRSALEWIHRQALDLVTHADLASFFNAQHAMFLDRASDKELERGIVCFLHLCQAAGLGTLTIGKRGQPARLRVERDELADYINGGSESVCHDAGRAILPSSRVAAAPHNAGMKATRNPKSSKLRLLISCGVRCSQLLAQIQATLDVIDVESHVCERSFCGGGTALLEEDALEWMRNCDAGLFVLTAEDLAKDGRRKPSLNQALLLEIGAAFALYGRRVVLVSAGCDFDLKGDLYDLPNLTLGNDCLTWDAGIELARVVSELK
jgi:hypothetical protein